MSDEEQGTVVTVYCPYCDRPYDGATKKAAEKIASKHVFGQHPELPNPFESDED